MDTYPEDAAHDQGFILQRADGTQSIVINNDVSKKDNAITPRSHELMHAVVLQTMKNNPDAIVGLGSALAKEINTINPADVAPGSRLATRLEQYKDQTQEVRAEELLSLFSDATMEGAIKYEDGLFTIEYNHHMKPYLLNLKKNFTKNSTPTFSISLILVDQIAAPIGSRYRSLKACPYGLRYSSNDLSNSAVLLSIS